MREWNLGAGDPLAMTVAADFRLCTPDYGNDHIWELEMGGGDPSAVALRTTYGLRARQMRIFPSFQVGAKVLTDPAEFASAPHLRRFAPNFLLVEYAPLPGLQVTAETWIPDSHTAAGRFSITNGSGEPLSVMLELCGQLVPMDGEPLRAEIIQSVHVLSGRCANLAPVIFLTGGPIPGQGPYASLALDLALAAGGVRTLTWVQAALGSHKESFEHARLTAARQWDAERARLELVNAAQTVEVQTGNPDWDAAFALSQANGLRLFFGPSTHLPEASFVLAREPDHGYSVRGDGSDHGVLWSGQPAMESLYLASVLSGAPELAEGLVRNFLAGQAEDGAVDWKPGMAGQHGRWLSTPLLAEMAWEAAAHSGDKEFRAEVFPKLDRFINRWLEADHDRDGDGFPEWDHPLQSGLEDHPLFPAWQTNNPGGDISCVETPALGAMLCHELGCLVEMAGELDKREREQELLARSSRLHDLVEESWDKTAVIHRPRDRDSHHSPTGKALGSLKGAGTLKLDKSFPHPVRLLVQVALRRAGTRHVELVIKGELEDERKEETLENLDFRWYGGRSTAVTGGLFSRVRSLKVKGLEANDRLSLRVMDFSAEDIGSFLPLWARIPDPRRARLIMEKTLLAEERFGERFGIPCTPAGRKTAAERSQAVHLPWNALIGEGLLAYGFREQAALLTSKLMEAVVNSLKQQRAFHQAYHAATGARLGERNAVQGLAPLGLFLKTVGVEFRLPAQVVLAGRNPFPWPVTVKYRGFTVTRTVEKTDITFPDGQSITLDDPTDAVVSAE